MKEIIGQVSIIFYINTWVASGLQQSLLIRGPSGCGKTEIAKFYARIAGNGEGFHYFLCGERGKVIPPRGNNPVILDEIHALKNVEQWFNFPNILIGCTTESTPVPDSLKTRMFEVWLAPYTQEELVTIITNEINIPELAAKVAAKRSRDTPRIALQIANQIKAYSSLSNMITKGEFEMVCNWFGFFEDGLSGKDHAYLNALKSGPRSVRALSFILSAPEKTILDEIEPFLLRRNKIMISSRGRELI